MSTDFYLVQDYEDERMAAQGNVGKDSWRHLGALGLYGESGEIVELVKKHLFHGKDLDHGLVVKECGDVLWYVTFTAHHAGLGLEGLMGVPAFRHFTDKSIFSGPDGLLMTVGSLGRDVGKLQEYLIFQSQTQYSINRDFIHCLCGVIWSLNSIAGFVSSNLEQVALANNHKLRARYPHGFSKAAAREVKACIACGSQDLIERVNTLGGPFLKCSHCGHES